MKYPYDAEYDPPCPAIQIRLHNSEDDLSGNEETALIDTGSDGTLVPLTYLRQILAPALVDTRIRSHWGEWRSVQLFAVDLEFDHERLPNVFVVGDDQGDSIILGRNVLNKLRLLLDGPANLTDTSPA
jgi:predicted aspartyl protease